MTDVQHQEPILVTGASGLLGAAFVAVAAAQHDVIACSGRHLFAWPNARACTADLTNEAATAAMLDQFRPRLVVNFAAATNLDRCEAARAEAEALNAGAAGAIARWCEKSGACLVHMSTDSVFDGATGGYTEAHEPAPLNAYARSKLNGERAVQASGCRHLIVRANIFGWNAQRKHSLAEWVLARLESGQPVPGFTDVIFNPLNVETLSELILTLVARGASGVVHVGSAAPISKHEFACLVAHEFGFDPGRVQPALLAGAGFAVKRPLNTALRCRRLEEEFGIELPRAEAEVARFRASLASGFHTRIQSALQTA
jgi:dTDP-4-dehydrorhamnose reductase